MEKDRDGVALNLVALYKIAKPEGSPNTMRGLGETESSKMDRARWEGRESVRRELFDYLVSMT